MKIPSKPQGIMYEKKARLIYFQWLSLYLRAKSYGPSTRLPSGYLIDCTVSLYSIAQLGCATGLPVAFKMVEISTDHMSQNALQLRDLLGYFHTT